MGDIRLRAGLYARISKDDDEEKGLGIQRQEEAGRRDLASLGIPIHRSYADNDLSGSGKVDRPDWDDMLAGIRAGEINCIWALDLDRLSRGWKPFVELYEACDEHKVLVLWRGGKADFRNGQGLLELEIRASFAREELRKMIARVNAKMAQLRGQGRFCGGSSGRSRPFGWEDRAPKAQWQEAREGEATVIRMLAQRARDGVNLTALARHLNAEGVKPVGGGRWTFHTLSRMLRSPRLAGLREVDGELVPGPWAKILDREDWEELVSVLESRKGVGPRERSSFLLTGMLRCGGCGERMHAKGQNYGCLRDRGGCNRVWARVAPLDELATETVFSLVDAAGFSAGLERAQGGSKDDELMQKIRRQRKRVADIEYMFGGGEMEPQEYKRAHGKAKETLDRMLAQLAPTPRLSALDAYRDGGLRQGWGDLSLSRRRAILQALGLEVTVSPALKRLPGGQFDTSRIKIKTSI